MSEGILIDKRELDIMGAWRRLRIQRMRGPLSWRKFRATPAEVEGFGRAVGQCKMMWREFVFFGQHVSYSVAVGIGMVATEGMAFCSASSRWACGPMCHTLELKFARIPLGASAVAVAVDQLCAL